MRHRSVVITCLIALTVAAAQAQAPAAKSPAKPAAAKPAAKAPAHPAAAHAAPMLNAADVKWGPAPPMIMPGAQFAVLDGDPGKPGPFAVRLKLPAGYKIMPHWHPTDEMVTVISGALKAGMGEKWDDASMKAFNAGAYARMPKKSPHYVQAQDETVVQVTATGPFEFVYVNAKDDPRKK